jgi:hypothetical protein
MTAGEEIIPMFLRVELYWERHGGAQIMLGYDRISVGSAFLSEGRPESIAGDLARSLMETYAAMRRVEPVEDQEVVSYGQWIQQSDNTIGETSSGREEQEEQTERDAFVFDDVPF